MPTEMVPRFWKNVSRLFSRIPEYDVEQLHARLLLGRDKLWLAVQTAGAPRTRTYMGVLVTTITHKPPTLQKRFHRTDPAQMRSLTIHLAGGEAVEGWIESAVERITAYGKEQHCRQLFLLAKKGWREQAMKFFSRDWDTVAYSRDRPTQAKGHRGTRLSISPGFYRVVVPAREVDVKQYASGTRCYVKEEGA